MSAVAYLSEEGGNGERETERGREGWGEREERRGERTNFLSGLF